MRSTTTVSEVASWADQQPLDEGFLIIVYHDVTDTDGSEYSTSAANLDAQLTAIEARRLPFVTVGDARQFDLSSD